MDDTVGSEKQNDIRRVLAEPAIISLAVFQPFFASLAFNRLAQDIRQRLNKVGILRGEGAARRGHGTNCAKGPILAGYNDRNGARRLMVEGKLVDSKTGLA